MRRAFNALFLLGAITGIYFLVGTALHWSGSTVAVCLSGICFCSGVFLRVLEI